MFNFTIAMKNLSNHFIISMPHINEPLFNRSIIIICEDNKDGSMGVVLNKPMNISSISEILQQTGLQKIQPKFNIYFGGPVQVDLGIILHESNYQTEGTINISESISLTSNNKIISDIKNGKGPSLFRFSFGYAGWNKGQLEREIENGDWLIMPADSDFIFSIPDKLKWEQAALQFGIDINNLGGSAGLA